MLTVQAAVHQCVQPASSCHPPSWLASLQMSSVLLLLLQQVSCSLVSENGDVLQFAVRTWNVADDALGVEIQPQNLVAVLSSQ